MQPEMADISDNGERVTHLYPNSSYQAHLSIYRFAAPYAQGADVLDAGSGSGYGSHYLALQGARSVAAIDISTKAVDFSRAHFQDANLHFQAMDLERIEGFADQSFDLIFSSNTLEHVYRVDRFLLSAQKLLRANGVFILAVPPIYNAESRAANLANPYHLNIWSPRQWLHVLGSYFEQVECVRHHLDTHGRLPSFADTPETCQFRTEEFVFLPSSVDELCNIGALTAIFVARRPRQVQGASSFASPPAMIDDSFTRAPNKNRGADRRHRVWGWSAAWTRRWQRLYRAMRNAPTG